MRKRVCQRKFENFRKISRKEFVEVHIYERKITQGCLAWKINVFLRRLIKFKFIKITERESKVLETLIAI
jgi:hypothetical protein